MFGERSRMEMMLVGLMLLVVYVAVVSQLFATPTVPVVLPAFVAMVAAARRWAGHFNQEP